MKAASALPVQTHLQLSTIAGAGNALDLSIIGARKNAVDLSIVAGGRNAVDLSIVAIDTRRRKAGISIGRLLGEARVDRRTWHGAKANPSRVRRSTLERLDRALARLAAGDRGDASLGAIGMLYQLAAGVLAQRAGIDPQAVLKIARDFSYEWPQNNLWLACARVRRLAMYVVANELGLGNATLARAIGCSRQNIKQAVTAVEELREEASIDALIAEIVALARVAP
jgi:hypothetical protein